MQNHFMVLCSLYGQMVPQITEEYIYIYIYIYTNTNTHTDTNIYNYIQHPTQKVNRKLSFDELSNRFKRVLQEIEKLIENKELKTKENFKLKCFYIYYFRIYMWIEPNIPNNLKSLFIKYFFSEKKWRNFYVNNKSFFFLLLLTYFFTPIFSYIYIWLLRNKYNRIF